jgi:hypothetical protein
MRKIWALAALAFVLVAGARTAAGQLQSYSSDDGRFSVQFPVGEVKHDTESVDLKGGGTTSLYEFWVEKGEGFVSYMVMYSDYPADYANGDPQTVLAGTRDGAVKNKTLVSDIVISLNGVPGREFTAKDDNWNYTVRQYLKGKRLYQLIVVSNSDHAATQTSDFLNSFKIN